MTLQRDALALSARDTVLLVVPMYHANAWGVVYSAPAVGAKLVLPGQRMDGESIRSEEHTSELQSLMRISYAVFCLKKKNNNKKTRKQQKHTRHKISSRSRLA